MPRTMLVAIGGNSLIRPGEAASLDVERGHVGKICAVLAQAVADGWRLVVTHGNGPQVGAAVRRSEVASAEAYPLPLDVWVASTQAEIGLLIQQALGDALEALSIVQPVATVLSQVVVDEHDPAFATPDKPIGPFYIGAAAEAQRRAGWTLVEEPPYGHRRVVPSPEPLDIVEEPAISALMAAGIVVIALGGGGVPVVRRRGRLVGVEAVVDKDLASALLATRLGVSLLVIVTDVDGVYLDFGRPDAKRLHTVTAEELRRHAADGQFPPGTMGPKVEAALRFVAAGGRGVVVTSPDRLIAALDGRAGTRVVGEAHAERRPRGAGFARRIAG